MNKNSSKLSILIKFLKSPVDINLRRLSFLQIDKNRNNVINDNVQHSSVSLVDESKLDNINLDYQLKNIIKAKFGSFKISENLDKFYSSGSYRPLSKKTQRDLMKVLIFENNENKSEKNKNTDDLQKKLSFVLDKSIGKLYLYIKLYINSIKT